MMSLKYMKNRLYNIRLLIQCLFFFFKRGMANKTPKLPPKTVLVAQLAWLGDMVCTTPVFYAIKQKYPKCRVIVVGEKRNDGLLSDNPDVDRYVIWENNFGAMQEKLKTEKIDFACSVTPNFMVLVFFYLLGIPVIAVPEIKGGWSPYETISFRLIRHLVIKKVHTMGSYAPREYLRLLESINIFSDNTVKKLGYSNVAKDKIDLFINDLHLQNGAMLVAISPSSGNKIKNWPANRFAKVSDFLVEKYNAKVFLIGSKNDQKEVETMIQSAKYGSSFINTLGKFSLDDLKCFISRMNLFIAVDTGPIYIAEAFNVPTIDIVGAMDEKEQPPNGDIHRVIIDPTRKSPEIHIMNARVYNSDEARRQIECITTDTVVKEVDGLIRDINKRNEKGK